MSAPVDDSYPNPPFLYIFYKDSDNGRIPPPPPSIPLPNTEFRSFGRIRTKNEDMNIDMPAEKMYKSGPSGLIDYKSELRRLTREMFFVYVEFLRVSSTDPSRHAATLSTFNRIFANVQHLLNSLRPHQARASLEYALAQQVEAMRSASEALNTKIVEADKCLERLADQLADKGKEGEL